MKPLTEVVKINTEQMICLSGELNEEQEITNLDFIG